MRGITFDGLHSHRDFNLTISSREIGNPSKIKIKERVPFSNEIYDFSGIYGGQEYTERPLRYTFNLIGNYTKESFSFIKISILNWLMRPNEKIKLKDDAIPGYYLLAELENAPELQEYEFDGTLTVEFTAYPFKIDENEEGDDIWDTFNFLLDYAQVTEYEISGSKTITLYNAGINSVSPTVKATSPMTIQFGNKTLEVPPGDSRSHDFILSKLENEMTITGNGTISFHFRKELI